jgi:hypothetical protein
MSSTVTVTVSGYPVTKTISVVSSTICSASSTNIQVPTSEVGVNYQLRNNATNAAVGGAVAGTGSTINLSTGSLGSTTTFNVLASNAAAGCATSMSNTVTVNVNPSPTDIAPVAVSSSICNGSSTNIQIALSQLGVNYQLRNNATNTAVGSAVAGNGGTINLPTGNLGSTTTFNVLATNTTTSCAVQMSITVAVMVYPFPTDKTVSAASSSVCSGNATNILVATSQSGVNYQLRDNATNAAVGSAVTGTGGTINLPTGILTSATTFNVLATNSSAACSVQMSSTATVTVTALPTVTISTNYCIGGGKVRLTSSSQNSYLWSTGATTQTIDVATAGNYTVTGTNAAGCSANANISVAAELVNNGNFSSGNTGFTTLYTYVGTPAANALWNEGTYTVATNANNYHSGFYCSQDHTSGSGNFMIVNGSPATQKIWEQTVTVVPNTTYYFSAWATSVNNGTPFAQLQFAVNSAQVGTTANLPSGASTTAGPFTWYQFYGTWNSGSNTSATINIIDLQTSLGGNDFGLDDISFSTLSPVTMTIAPTTNSPICAGNTLNLTSNVTGGSSPFTYSWTGPGSYASSIQNPAITNAAAANAGVYSLIVTDGYGCTANGSTSSVTINPLPTDKTLTAASANICSGSSTNIQVAISQSGVNYQLRNNSTNTLIGSVVAGTGGAINLSTGTLLSTTTFNVLATNATTSCNTQMSGTVTVTVAAYPVAKIISTAAASVCSGISTNIQVPTSEIGVNYQLRNNTGNINIGIAVAGTGGTINLSTGNLTANTTFNVLAVNAAAGCTTSMSNTVTVTVNALPTITGTLSVCIGSTTQLTGSGTAAASNPWVSASTGIATVNATGLVSGLSAGTSIITYTNNNGCSNTATVAVNPIPTITVSAAASAVCFSAGAQTSTLSYSATTNSPTAYHIFWSSAATTAGFGNVSNAPLPASPISLSVPAGVAAGTYTGTLIVSTSSGCVSAGKGFSLTVNALPILTGASSVCVSNNTTLSPTTAGSWISNNTALATITNAGVITGVSAGAVTFTYTQTSTGCSNTTASFTVNASPTVNALTGTNAVCAGTTTTFNSTTSGGVYSSSNTGVATVNSSTGQITAVSAGTATISYAVTNGSGCTTVITRGITVNALPIDKIPTAVTTTVCTGNSTSIQIAASQSGVDYQLRNNTTNAAIGSAVAGTGGTINLPTGTLSSTAVFNVLATNTSTSCNVQMSSTVTITVNSTGTWVGGATGDWNLASNWCGGIPTASTDVIIPAASTVNIQTANAVANSVTIASNGTLTMTGANNLTISSGGSLTNNGNFNASGTGTVVFAGNGTIRRYHNL